MGEPSFPPLRLTFPERGDWVFSRILEHWARTTPDRPSLQFMDEPAVNIASFDIETVIAEHPLVAECAVAAVLSEFAGGEDEVKACLVLREGASFVPEEFLGWCEEKLPYFAVPRYVELLSELPKTPSNKVQKYLLRQAGITPATWDRVQAGCQLKEEAKRAEEKRQRKREARDGV